MMNTRFKNAILVLSLVMIGCNFSSCDDDNNPVNEEEYDTLYRQILTNYVDKTIIPTYKNMAEAALGMRKANEALKANPSDETMKAASEAWMAARIWWEMSEAFLFGPVSEDGFNIDAHIDSWPLELEDIKRTIEEENGAITGKEAWNLEEGVIGFHTTEFLLYRNGQSRPINDLSEAELKYLIAVTDALVWDCIIAYVAWAGESNVSADMLAVFNENEDIVDFYKSRPNFQNFGKKMKMEESFYSSLEAAVTEISEGAKTIAEEVGATKIDAPYADQKIEEVESWYSWHSLDDYTNNIASIKNAYLGGLNDSSRTSVSLSTYIAIVDPTLDDQIKDKIQDCMDKIEAIGTGGKSFYEVVNEQINKDEVDAAVAACLELRDLFGKASESVQ